MEFNKYQSSIEDLNIDSYPLEIKEAFYDFMTNVPYIKSLVSPNRPYAKDCPRDSEGKIIVDLTNPPIIEDTDYFRPTAIHYQKYGCLTKLRPNPNPNSEYGKWIREEIRRIYFGYIRKSDGAWVTGDMYFFLNYCPIVKVKRIQGKQGIRTVDFPDFLEGQWLKFMYIEQARKNAKHGSELASRGKGKSYCMAAILARRFILGEYDIIKKEPTKKVESFVASYLKNYLNEDGVLNKFESYIDFCAEASEFPRKRLISSINNMHWQMGYKENESVAKKGSLNEVIGISVKDSAGKLRGKRGAFIGLEEFGSFPNLIELYGTLRPSMEDGDIVFGMIYCQGTSGDKESDFSAAQKIMYSPKAFNMQSIPNVYDKVGQGKRDFVYFYPAYVNRNGCYNKDGISDVTKAILEVLINRYNVKYNTTDANLITKTIAEHPIVPQEAIMRTQGNMFPVQQINQRLNELDNNPNEYDDVYIANLLLQKDGTVKYSPSTDIPIREYPLKDNRNKGAIEIYELPQKDNNGNVFSERYIIGHDPVDDDVSNTSSLTSTFVLDLLTDRIVAEYTGRQEYADDNFEIVRKLCIFYNAKCLYECHPYSQKVIKADGTRTTWKDINVGDMLHSIGGSTKVIDIPFNQESRIYKIKLKDGRIVMAGEDHAWDVIKLEYPDKWFTITTKQMLNQGVKDKYGRHRFFIPNAGIVNYLHQEVPIDPYTFGLLLAEGAFTKFKVNKHEKFTRRILQFSSSKEDAEFYKEVLPYQIKYIGTKGYSWHIYINNIDEILKSLGLLFCRSEDKFIPDIYLYNDYNTRLELLKGLMDGDGCANTNGAQILVTSSQQLKNTVMSLCRSLGLNCSYKKIRTKSLPCYRISIYADILIFKLPRKTEQQHLYKFKTKGSKAISFVKKTAIEAIEYSHVEKAKCVTVDRHDGLYLIGDYVLTHNCNKKGIFAYFNKMNSLQWLAETPTYLKDQQIIKEIGYGNKSRGVNATVNVNAFADRLTREWLIKPVTITKSIKDSDEQEITLPNLMFMKNKAFLQELAAYNPNGNFDRIRAFGMLMIYRYEKIIMYQGDMNKIIDEDRYRNLPENDEFFKENYDYKFGSE